MKIPLFFDGYDLKAYDLPFGQNLSQLRERARYLYRSAKGVQPRTGFYTAFANLVRSIESTGHEVHVNNFRLARNDPARPIGMSGFMPPFARFGLTNPVIYGPGRVPDPNDLDELRQTLNLKIVTYPSEWPIELNAPDRRDLFATMFVGIDTDAWPDISSEPKTCDVLLYNKVRWHQAERERDLLRPIRSMLKRRGLSWKELRYGAHNLETFRKTVTGARSMIFVAEHETQGLAYQEAMSSNLPVFAWDDGELVDPSQRKLAGAHLRVSSVPYFDQRCGLTFTRDNIEERFEDFWKRRADFRPRDYVLEHLSLERGAQRFLDLYATML